jgi:hypothetical protein
MSDCRKIKDESAGRRNKGASPTVADGSRTNAAHQFPGRFLILLPLAAMLMAGCAVVVKDGAPPKSEWYWSAEAVEARHDNALEKANEKLFEEQVRAGQMIR